MTRPVVVIDIGTPLFLGNRMLERDFAAQYPGLDAVVALSEELAERGIDTVTVDVYLEDPESWATAAALSFETTSFTASLLSAGAVPAVCLSLESPVFARDFYRNLRQVAAYHHVFLWRGTRSRVRGAEFHEVHWPYPTIENRQESAVQWADRRFLTLVASNKLAYSLPSPLLQPLHPGQSVRNVRAAVDTLWDRYRDPWFRTEYYTERLDAIRHFAGRDGFDLFGRGWDDAQALPARYAEAVHSAYRGELPALAKVETMAGYRFALCYENTSFPGYVTEKIFDSFASGAIPVYLGAPDVSADIPSAAFVDLRAFGTYARLDEYLTSMSAQRAAGYIEAAQRFTSSTASRSFTQERFVQEVLQSLVRSLEVASAVGA